MKVRTRLYVDDELAAAREIVLAAEQAHRLRNVLRLAAGAAVAAFNGRDGEWAGELIEIGRNQARLALRERLRAPEAGPDLWLVFAPIKKARLDWLVEKATELGIAALLPVRTAHTQAERLNADRLRAEAIAAAEQCERLSIPTIGDLRTLQQLIAGWPSERILVVCDETGGGEPIADVFAEFAGVSTVPAAVLIGPEGGLEKTELDALGKLSNVRRVGLGPRVLRAETAAIAALAVFQAMVGDWRRRPADRR